MDTEELTVVISIADGRTLSARLWRPAGNGQWPAIIDASPYRVGDLSRPVHDRRMRWYALQGYAALAIDISGSGNATGILRDEYARQEIDDLVAAVEWASKQDWCDGNVGLTGFSWSAFAALRAAARKPAVLKAMVLGGVSEDGWRTDIHYQGGALYTAQIDWAGVMLMLNALPPDPAQFTGDWRSEWKRRLEANEPWIVPWLAHATHDAYWTGKAADLAAAGDIPLLLYAGVADKYAVSVLRIAAEWPGPVRTIVGPWEHSYPDVAARGPRIGFLQESLRWWDRFLKGRETDVLAEAPLRLWLGVPDAEGQLREGVWIASDWPPPQTALDFVLLDGQLITSRKTDGTSVTLSAQRENPPALASDLYEDSPAPFDWRREQRRGALVVSTAPFDADCELGPTPALRCRTSARHGLVVARLLDVSPEGVSIRMATAAFNLASHDGSDELDIPFQAVAWRLRKGHRLALVLSTDGWPTFWPARDGRDVTLANVHLSVPVVQGLASVPTPSFDPPIRHAAPSLENLRWIDPEKEGLPPPAPGAVSLSARSAAHHLSVTGTDYFIASRLDLELLPEDQARAAKFYRVAFERPDWSIRIQTMLEVTSTPDAFHIAWHINARDGEAIVHEANRKLTVPRTTV